MPAADPDLEDEAQSAVGEPVVDDPDDGREAGAEIVEPDGLAMADGVPPLPVGVELGRESSASAGWFGSHSMPRVWGGWPSVQAVFQKMLEKPRATLAAFLGPLTVAFLEDEQDLAARRPGASAAAVVQPRG